jgi:MoaA/NifB/PqqE/SkfB family radical SAM enzyme
MTATATATIPPVVQLELTGMCNLTCTHCYASSSPRGTNGTMAADNWESVITQAAAMGIPKAQFIGGEPTLYTDLPRLIRHALAVGMSVNVFSNLVHVSPDMWKLLALPAVSLATSWYAADPDTHAAITGSRPAYAATRASIARAVELGIPVRVAIIAVQPGQDTAAAEAEVRALGVTNVTTRPVQGVGRATDEDRHDPAELCGRCGTTMLAVLPNGQVTPCGIGRWLECGDVRQTPLADILSGSTWQQALALILSQGRACPPGDADNCAPDDETIDPNGAMLQARDCPPQGDGGDCPPAAEVPCAPESKVLPAARSLPLVTVG